MVSKQPEEESGEESANSPDAGGTPARGGECMLFDNGIFAMARRSHPVRLVLAGEVDFSSIPQLTAALLDATDGAGVLHVDLADAYFCDLAALRTIIGLGPHSEQQPPRRRARSVVLHNVPDHVGRVLRIVGWDTTPGLTIVTGVSSTEVTGVSSTDQSPCPTS